MQDRGEDTHSKVIYGNTAELGEHAATRQCVARSISEKDSGIELCKIIARGKEKMQLKTLRTGRSLLAKITYWRDNFMSVAFCSEARYELPVSNIAERLRKSEKKKRQLQRRINQLLDEG